LKLFEPQFFLVELFVNFTYNYQSNQQIKTSKTSVMKQIFNIAKNNWQANFDGMKGYFYAGVENIAGVEKNIIDDPDPRLT